MRIKPDESKEDWAKRVQQYEYGYALQQIAKGEDLNLVMEAMGARIQQKLLHPVFRAIREKLRVRLRSCCCQTSLRGSIPEHRKGCLITLSTT